VTIKKMMNMRKNLFDSDESSDEEGSEIEMSKDILESSDKAVRPTE
jgi:hypothetical protein